MLKLDAQEWQNFEGGYRDVYDASVPLRNLIGCKYPDANIWDELWENLYHQGDVGIASYAVVPHLLQIYQNKNWVDFHLPAFVGAIERARKQKRNPKLPEWLELDYLKAVNSTAQYCMAHSAEIDDRNFARALIMLTAVLVGENEIYELLESLDIGDEKRLLEII